MIFRHKRTGDLYRKMGEAFTVETQRPCVVYMSLKEGQVFCRDAEAFKENFTWVKNSQDTIVPHQRSQDQPQEASVAQRSMPHG